MSNDFIIKQLSSLDEIPCESWNSLIDTDNPFVRYEYLYGLERFDCLKSHGWVPCHLVLYSGSSLTGALPLYIRTNSYGEFVFDWSWADAYERAGGKYYPKLVSAIPFAPVSGPRLLVNPKHPQVDIVKQQLIEKVLQIIKSNHLSSYHCLFPSQSENIFLEKNLLQRHTVQYHWRNQGYIDFNDFLGSMNSKKRKQIRRERKKIIESMVDIECYTGGQMNEYLWDVYYEFYCSTFHKRWGNPRLTKDFFYSLSNSMPSETLIILAKAGENYIAGSFLMKGKNTLYGRHWGCVEQLPYLHFELCYYQPIQYCIEKGIKFFDAGVQGEHKLARGFDPVITNSFHWIEDINFRTAIEEFLVHEKREINVYVNELSLHLPYKNEAKIEIK